LDEWWGAPVDLDFYFMRTAELSVELEAAGFRVTAALERVPYEPHEGPTRRGYLLVERLPTTT